MGRVDRVSNPPAQALDAADRLTLAEAVGGDGLVDRRDRALLLFLLSTACRISEALGLDR